MTIGVGWQKERLTRSVRRVAGRYGPVARATHGDKRAIRLEFGSGCDHPSPSIPLPVEGRGKPVAMRPERLDVLAASVTDLQTVTCIICFLKVFKYLVKRWESGSWGWLVGYFGRGATAARLAGVLSSRTGLWTKRHANPVINHWAIFFRPPGLMVAALHQKEG